MAASGSSQLATAQNISTGRLYGASDSKPHANAQVGALAGLDQQAAVQCARRQPSRAQHMQPKSLRRVQTMGQPEQRVHPPDGSTAPAPLDFHGLMHCAGDDLANG